MTPRASEVCVKLPTIESNWPMTVCSGASSLMGVIHKATAITVAMIMDVSCCEQRGAARETLFKIHANYKSSSSQSLTQSSDDATCAQCHSLVIFAFWCVLVVGC